MKKIEKIPREEKLALLTERKLKQESLNLSLKKSKRRFKDFEYLVERAYERKLEKDLFDPRIEILISSFSKSKNKYGPRLLALKNLLIHLYKIKSKMIKNPEIIRGISEMCKYKSYWIRDFKDWKPKSNNVNNQLNELADQLFCKYSPPRFLYSVWTDEYSQKYVLWFIDLGRGGSVRKLRNMPIDLTKKMAHLFLLADKNYRIEEALRWGQVLGLGGSLPLAKRIARSRLASNDFTNEALWKSFIQILINANLFNHDKIGELIDFVSQKKREEASYSLKGRTLTSLLRQSEEWHRAQLGIRHFKQLLEWESSGLTLMEFSEGGEYDKTDYTLVELLNSRELTLEGKYMHHCVGSYASYCVKKRTAIFSIRKSRFGMEEDRLATIEVNLAAKRVIQAKYKYNKQISGKAKAILQKWAAQNRLVIGDYL